MRTIAPLIAFCCLLPFLSLGQGGDLAANSVAYPRYILDPGNNTKCVIFTLDQARKIDNDAELLKMYKLVNVSSDSLIESLVFKVNVQDSAIALLQVKTSELERVNSTQNSLITNLESQIDDYKKDIGLADQQLTLKTQQIKNLDKEVRRQKRLMILGYAVGGLGIVLAVLAAL